MHKIDNSCMKEGMDGIGFCIRPEGSVGFSSGNSGH